MSKRSFNEIEQAIKHAAEAHEPVFDEASWKKMETLLDQDKDRRRPVAFWLWWLLPLLIGAGVLSYFVFNGTDKEKSQQETAIQKNSNPAGEIKNNVSVPVPATKVESLSNNDVAAKINADISNDNYTGLYVPLTAKNKKIKSVLAAEDLQTEDDEINAKTKPNDKIKGKLNATIKPATPSADYERGEDLVTENNSGGVETIPTNDEKKEEIIVIKVDADKTSEREIEKIIDSVVEKVNNDKESKKRISRLYIIAAAGAEASGVKLFSADKVTGRFGLGLGYQLNKNISVQTGFYVSSKKYGATGRDYKTKPGSYWSTVDIKYIDAKCRIYEIPVSVVYNFTPGKKLNIFASAGLSSYIMKREDYHLYYDHYGIPYQADVYYKGNKNLFSVLRFSAGIEKKISNRFSVNASPGLSVPLSGVGDGEVKLYSADITIGLKFTPFQKK